MLLASFWASCKVFNKLLLLLLFVYVSPLKKKISWSYFPEFPVLEKSVHVLARAEGLRAEEHFVLCGGSVPLLRADLVF